MVRKSAPSRRSKPSRAYGLEGQVHLWREREVAERAAWSVPGVAKVDDHLKIA
ncbi:BON domain-containing protein [Stutzerimonas stutzeri]|uniref:BON domain-containing protein n=1 Tax=Stutzerimonas stutzeri TaxID=316 RepID=UPI003C6F115C